jgi:hypothetical protein
LSDTIFKLIPENINFKPAHLNIDQARLFFESIFPIANITVMQSKEIQFVDPGESFYKITCPICDNLISLEWWHNAMEIAWETSFEELNVQLPCCLIVNSLHELKYDWAAGFSRFILSIENPNNDLNEEQFIRAEQILGCKIRQVIAYI